MLIWASKPGSATELRNLRLGRVMVHDLGLERGDRVVAPAGDRYVRPMRNRAAAIDVVFAAGAEVVGDGDLMAGRDIGVDDVGADEAGPTSDENPHRQ